MSAENRAHRRNSSIMHASSEAAFSRLLGLYIPERKTIYGEFQLRADKVEGQTLGTLREKNDSNIGTFLRPGRYTVIAFQETDSRIIAQDIRAINHAHAAWRAQRIARRQNASERAEVIPLRTPNEHIAEVIDGGDFARGPQRSTDKQFANDNVVYRDFRHRVEEPEEEQIANAEIRNGDFAHGPRGIIRRMFANDGVVSGDFRHEALRAESDRAAVIPITVGRRKRA